MIGNVMSAGSSAWDDVRLLLQVASKPDAIVDELQDLIAKAKAAQAAADKSTQDSVVGLTASAAGLKAVQNAQDVLAADKVNLAAQWVELNETADKLHAQHVALDKNVATVTKAAADLAKRETVLDAREATIESRDKMVAELQDRYTEKLAQLRSIVA